MTPRLVLRSLAIVIAGACLADPSVSREIERSELVTVVAASDAALPAALEVREGLAPEVEARVEVHSPGSAAAACPAAGQCVLVSDGELPAHASAGARVLAVVDAGGDAVIERIDAPLRVHPGAVPTLRVHTSRPVARIDVLDGETLVGSAVGPGPAIDVPWVPVSTGARVLRVIPIEQGSPNAQAVTAGEAVTVGQGFSLADAGEAATVGQGFSLANANPQANTDIRHVAVIVDPTAVPVLFYEPRATWLGTYVRRALEDDPRFELRGRARVAPPVTISRGERSALTVAALDDVGAVVVTAPEMLTASEVMLLEQFVIVRGGSLIVLADQRPTGQALRLLPRIVSERRETQPRDAGPLRATEWLTFDDAVGVSSLAAIDKQPVIISRVFGRGRVIASGALDAWRYRAASDGFSSFWTTLTWDAAVVAGPRLRLRVDPVAARPGEEVSVTAELQGMGGGTDSGEQSFTASGQVTCGSEQRFLRLWPDARPGSFRGRWRADAPASCVIRVAVGDEVGTAAVTFRDDLPPRPSEDQQLEALAAAHGAAFVRRADAGDVRARIADSITTSAETSRVHPMRSPWWVLPFALCLAGEWWLRRQSGLS